MLVVFFLGRIIDKSFIGSCLLSFNWLSFDSIYGIAVFIDNRLSVFCQLYLFIDIITTPQLILNAFGAHLIKVILIFPLFICGNTSQLWLIGVCEIIHHRVSFFGFGKFFRIIGNAFLLYIIGKLAAVGRKRCALFPFCCPVICFIALLFIFEAFILFGHAVRRGDGSFQREGDGGRTFAVKVVFVIPCFGRLEVRERHDICYQTIFDGCFGKRLGVWISAVCLISSAFVCRVIVACSLFKIHIVILRTAADGTHV